MNVVLFVLTASLFAASLFRLPPRASADAR
jgi:hypothetical protein